MGVCPENEPDLVNRDPNGINAHIKVKCQNKLESPSRRFTVNTAG